MCSSNEKRDATGASGSSRLGVLLFLRYLDPALDLSDAVEIVVDRPPVLLAQAALQIDNLVRDRVENAAVLLGARETLGRAAALPEHPLEHLRGLISIGIGVVGVRHESGVHVDAAVVTIACPDEAGLILGGELERGSKVSWPILGRCNLVGRDARIRVHALSRLRADSTQPRGGTQRVDSRCVRGSMPEAADDIEVIAERLERLEDGRELEPGAFHRRPSTCP